MTKDFRSIEDKYFPHTQLRFRTIRDAEGNLLARKLTQKSVHPGQIDYSKTTITNIYLSENEAALINGLPGLILKKNRYALEKNGIHFSIDQFLNTELVLAEVEFETEELMHQFKVPFDDWKDVSQDEHFTGAYLAFHKGSDD